ncbi:hypothetical protein EVAR_49835_1 [Eumeta japonica]|uniref:Uncharacterized protein n=1 Tax=Eumeta variegata TaxID=151549 RepID=A0A4C1YZI8_EUMVA|nr:hypothetical protein EVAR_49835_1 [Eumeta japonica]
MYVIHNEIYIIVNNFALYHIRHKVHNRMTVLEMRRRRCAAAWTSPRLPAVGADRVFIINLLALTTDANLFTWKRSSSAITSPQVAEFKEKAVGSATR